MAHFVELHASPFAPTAVILGKEVCACRRLEKRRRGSVSIHAQWCSRSAPHEVFEEARSWKILQKNGCALHSSAEASYPATAFHSKRHEGVEGLTALAALTQPKP